MILDNIFAKKLSDLQVGDRYTVAYLCAALLGVIPRECPSTPLGELLFEVQSCKTDADCWPRICCPDGARSYCRTAKARLDLVPVANQIDGR